MEKESAPRLADDAPCLADDAPRLADGPPQAPTHARRQKDAILDILLRYFTAQGYYLATAVDYRENVRYPYVGKVDENVEEFVVLENPIVSVDALRAAEATHFSEFMRAMAGLLATQASQQKAQ